ncbi:MAG: M23 family metallopeptidase, partial [Maribacter sp.]|nr:M23 family metallopeptidase [Maribacter sp.]
MHLEKGSLISMGEKIKQGQSIGISGKTGYTSVEHLHFNMLTAANTEEGLESIPVEFVEGYKGIELSRNDFNEKMAIKMCISISRLNADRRMHPRYV